MIERTFTQDSGSPAWAVSPASGVVFEPALTHDINVPRLMFEQEGAWHSPSPTTSPAGYQPTFTVTPFSDPGDPYSFLVTTHEHRRGITGCNVFGDDILIAQWSQNRDPAVMGTDYAAWSTAWTELNEGMTLAIASPAAYSGTHSCSSVLPMYPSEDAAAQRPDGAAVPDHCFWKRRRGRSELVPCT
jgi:hypothetical protein